MCNWVLCIFNDISLAKNIQWPFYWSVWNGLSRCSNWWCAMALFVGFWGPFHIFVRWQGHGGHILCITVAHLTQVAWRLNCQAHVQIHVCANCSLWNRVILSLCTFFLFISWCIRICFLGYVIWIQILSDVDS